MKPATRYFAATAVLAIVLGGLLAAATAHAPTRHLNWLAGYLVLVVGVAQYVLGAAGSHLVARPRARGAVRWHWAILNLGHAGVIAGTLVPSFALVAAGTVVYIVGTGWFGLVTLSASRRDMRILAYRVLVVALLVTAVVGLGLSASGR